MARVDRLVAVVGLALALFALLAWGQGRSPVGVVLDLRRPGLVSAILGLLFLGARLPGALSRRAGGGARRGATVYLLPGLALAALALQSGSLFLDGRAEEVRFRNGEVALAGTLHLPRGPGPFPAVIVIHGAGRESRKEPAFYARLYARHGIAALAYDKRGSGDSTGELYEAHYEDLARDAVAGIDLLKGRPDIDRRRIGILGFSEGEWVGALAATQAPDVAFLAVVSASGRSPAEQVAYELQADLRAGGFDEAVIAKAAALNERLFAFQRSGTDREGLVAALAAASGEPWFKVAGLPDDLGSFDDWSWWRSVMDFDPIPVWRGVTCPVLLVSGGRDTKSPVRDSQERIRRALFEGGNTRFTGVVHENAVHGLVEWWLPARLPPPRFPDGYPGILALWALQQTRLP